MKSRNSKSSWGLEKIVKNDERNHDFVDDGEALALALFSSSMKPSLVSPHRSDVFSSRGVVSSPAVSIRHFSLKT